MAASKRARLVVGEQIMIFTSQDVDVWQYRTATASTASERYWSSATGSWRGRVWHVRRIPVSIHHNDITMQTWFEPLAEQARITTRPATSLFSDVRLQRTVASLNGRTGPGAVEIGPSFAPQDRRHGLSVTAENLIHYHHDILARL
jgi:hypothetical protein